MQLKLHRKKRKSICSSFCAETRVQSADTCISRATCMSGGKTHTNRT